MTPQVRQSDSAKWDAIEHETGPPWTITVCPKHGRHYPARRCAICGRGIETVAVVPAAQLQSLRDALSMAVYHAVNLKRLKNAEVVRDFSESQAGFERAVQTLEAFDG